MTAQWLLRVFALATILVACSASAVHKASISADMLARGSNAALEIVKRVYHDQLMTVSLEACGHVTPCADPDAMREAQAVIVARWKPVFGVWSMMRIAHLAWKDQLNRCQEIQADAGTEAKDCAMLASDLAVVVVQHLDETRCAMRAIGVSDPFPGEVSCAKDGGQ